MPTRNTLNKTTPLAMLSDVALLPAITWPAWALLIAAPDERWLEQTFLAAVFGLTFIALPLSRRLAWFLVLTSLPLAALWGIFGNEFGLAPNIGTLAAVLHTDRAEAWEWLARRPWQGISITLWLVLTIALCYFSPPGRIWPQLGRRKVLAGILLLTLGSLLHYDYWYGRQGQWTLINGHDLDRIWPASPLWLAAGYVWRATPELITLSPTGFVNPHRLPATLDGSDTPESINVVLVIGESHRADYFDPTHHPDLLPGLAKRLAEHRLIQFSDVCAAATLTQFSVPALVTGATIERIAQEGHDLPSGLAYLKAAGFSTGWLSNQDDDVFGETGWDMASYTQRRASRRKPDEVLLPPIIETLRRYPQRLGLVVHLQGSHFDYDQRYPLSQAHLPTDGLNGIDAERAHYTNSVAYSGWLLEQILQLLDRETRPSVLLFVSDHGENLRDDARQLFRHGSSPKVSRFELKVPALVAWNNSFALHYGKKLTTLKQNANQALNFTNLFALWQDLGGLHTTATAGHRNPASRGFEPSTPRNFFNVAAMHVEHCEDLN